jgi:hypothetical protein
MSDQVELDKKFEDAARQAAGLPPIPDPNKQEKDVDPLVKIIREAAKLDEKTL